MTKENGSGRTKGGVHSKFPCGCWAIRGNSIQPNGAGPNEILLLENGQRVCKCGKKWESEWHEVKSS